MPTPGPYRVLTLGSEGCAILAKPPGHQHEIRLAVVNGKSLPEDLENAHLLAAAPEMLEALQALVLHVLHYSTMPHAHSGAARDAANALDAIAKATKG